MDILLDIGYAYGIFMCLGVYFIAKKLQIMRTVNHLFIVFIGYHEKKGRYVMEGRFGRSG